MHSFACKALFFCTFLLILFVPAAISADTLFIAPISGTYSVGDTFPVRILVSSPRQSVNAISGTLSFPTDKLQISSISKIGSIVSLWVQEPTFSNSHGTVNFEGVIPNPGWSESNGRVLTINFRVINSGAAELRFSNGTLLANDGYGTNVLKTLGTANLTFEQRREQLLETLPAVLETGEDAGGAIEPVIVEATKSETEVSLEIPPWDTVYAFLFKFFSIVIPLLALIFLLIHLFHRGVHSVRVLRNRFRKDLHNIDHLVEKSFDIIKEDISDSIHMLERTRSKRQLTAEEDAIIHRLRQNLVDAEKIIHREVLNAEKDLGD